VKVRSYTRARAGLSPVTVGQELLNQGHRSLYRRELIIFHDFLPKDAVIHDGLQLLDGANRRRHLVQADVAVVVAAPPPTVPAAKTPAPSGLTRPEPQAGVVLPTLPHAMRLAPLLTGYPFRPASQAAREAERQRQHVVDDDEDEANRSVSDEYAAW